jgi:futalosine hydrolase
MDLLIVSATTQEIRILLEKCGIHEEIKNGEFREVRWQRLNVRFLVTGVGSPLSLLHLGRMTGLKTWDLILNVGIAGSFKEDHQPGEVLVVTREVFGDLGIMGIEKFSMIWEKGLQDQDEFPFTGGILYLPLKSEWNKLLQCKEVKGITVNAMNSGLQAKSDFFTHYQPDTESMEGAAVALFSSYTKTDCIQLRAVSNFTWQTDSKTWNINDAIQKLNKVAGSFLDSLNQLI